jgi:hypothetical protein
MIEGRENFWKNRIYIQEKSRGRKGFILDFFTFRKIKKWNGCKTEIMTLNTYLRCMKITPQIAYNFQTIRTQSKNTRKLSKYKNKANCSNSKDK